MVSATSQLCCCSVKGAIKKDICMHSNTMLCSNKLRLQKLVVGRIWREAIVHWPLNYSIWLTFLTLAIKAPPCLSYLVRPRSGINTVLRQITWTSEPHFPHLLKVGLTLHLNSTIAVKIKKIYIIYDYLPNVLSVTPLPVLPVPGKLLTILCTRLFSPLHLALGVPSMTFLLISLCADSSHSSLPSLSAKVMKASFISLSQE